MGGKNSNTGGQAISRKAVIRNTRGLHARAAAKFAETAAFFNAEITVEKDNLQARGDSIMGLLMLVAAKDAEILISGLGPEAGDAVNALCVLIENKFEEKD